MCTSPCAWTSTRAHARIRTRVRTLLEVCNNYCLSTAQWFRDCASLLLYAYIACIVGCVLNLNSVLWCALDSSGSSDRLLWTRQGAFCVSKGEKRFCSSWFASANPLKAGGCYVFVQGGNSELQSSYGSLSKRGVHAFTYAALPDCASNGNTVFCEVRAECLRTNRALVCHVVT